MTITINKDTIKNLVTNVENTLVKDATVLVQDANKVIRADETKVAQAIHTEVDNLVKAGQSFVGKVKAEEHEIVKKVEDEVKKVTSGKFAFTGFGKGAKFFLLPTVTFQAGQIDFGWLFLTWAYSF